MKPINIFAIIAIITAFSCRTQTNPEIDKIDFGIYESSIFAEPELFDLSTMRKVIGLTDIRKTKAEGMEVVLYLNMEGAKKWAEMTKNNIGKTIAFAVNGEIVYTPMIAAELRNGIIKIADIGDETKAKSLSESLNASIPK